LDVHIEVRELIPVGDSTVVAVATWRARGEASGAAVEQTRALVFYIQGGKIVRVEPHASKAEALGAAKAKA
jgi:ketosteroid isomerase-like protein